MSSQPGNRHRMTRKRRSASRRWCLPAAISREPYESVESALILEDFKDDFGLQLWCAVRDVNLWAATDALRRAGLFADSAVQKRRDAIVGGVPDASVEVWLTSLTAVVGSPAQADPAIVSLVCLQLADWAQSRGAYATAVEFAQAAANARPEDPNPALRVGVLALAWGREARAETWLRRAIGLARRVRAWDTYGRAYVALGKLYAARDLYAPAARYYVSAWKCSRRAGIWEVRAQASHGLFFVAVEQGNLDAAYRHARDTLRAYGRTHPRFPEALHDFAYLLVLRGQHDRALTMLRKLLVSRTAPDQRAFTLAVMARAAAGAGAVEAYREAWSDGWLLINSPASAAGYDFSPALLELARAASAARDPLRAEQVAKLYSISRARRESVQTSVNAELLELIISASAKTTRS